MVGRFGQLTPACEQPIRPLRSNIKSCYSDTGTRQEFPVIERKLARFGEFASDQKGGARTALDCQPMPPSSHGKYHSVVRGQGLFASPEALGKTPQAVSGG